MSYKLISEKEIIRRTKFANKKMFRQLVADLCKGLVISPKITVGANYLKATIRVEDDDNVANNGRTVSLMHTPGTKRENLWLFLEYKTTEPVETISVMNNTKDTLTKKELKKLQTKITDWILFGEK